MTQVERESKIRPATPHDVPEIFAMICELATYERARDEVQSNESLLRDGLFSQDPKVWATVCESVEADGHTRTAGFALWFLNYSTWTAKHSIYLEDLYVREEFRGRGYGKALLRHLAQICVERGYPRLDWWVLDWNDRAIGFYQSVGAVGMHEWTVNRLTGPALERFAADRDTGS